MEESLRAALARLGVDVPVDFLKKFKDDENWIKQTCRFEVLESMMHKSTTKSISSTFCFDHFVSAATELFNQRCFHRQMTVVVGPIFQGKSQFLYFLCQLLQALDENVIYIDNSIAPYQGRCFYYRSKIVKHWSTHKLDDSCRDHLTAFKKSRSSEDLELLFSALMKFAETNRVWVIADDVVKLSEWNVPIPLPEEQSMIRFQWIVSGNTGIDSWVRKQHLEMWVFDLPPFNQADTWKVVQNVASSMDLELRDGMDGITFEGLPDYFNIVFGGNIGLVVEYLIMKKKGIAELTSMKSLRWRLQSSIVDEPKSVNKIWFDIERYYNPWQTIRNCGFCGVNSPRGIILAWIVKYISQSANIDLMSTVKMLQQRNSIAQDAGLDGCLFKMEAILKLQNGEINVCGYLSAEGNGDERNWKVGYPSTMLKYNKPKLANIHFRDTFLYGDVFDGKPGCYLIKLPMFFDVIDAVILEVTWNSHVACGIQMTQSKTPFLKHQIFETCTIESQKKLMVLCNAISRYFKIHLTLKNMKFGMYAPNCLWRECTPPLSTNQKGPYYIVSQKIFDELQSQAAIDDSSLQIKKRKAE